jgi:hypothetical protein
MRDVESYNQECPTSPKAEAIVLKTIQSKFES